MDPPLSPTPDLATLNQHALAYADRRTRKEAVDAALAAQVDATSEAAAVRDLETQMDAARDRLLQASQSHPLRPQLVQLAAEEEAARKALLAIWPDAVRAGIAKTITVPLGQVQLRTTKGVQVTDPAALAFDLLAKQLFKPAVKGLTVDGKLLRPLVDAGTLAAGIQASDTHTLAWTSNATPPVPAPAA